MSRSRTRSIIAKTLMITPSGALSPGPLSASAIAVGASLGYTGGILVALGHMIFELPYVALLVYAFARIRGALARVQKHLTVAVTAFIAYFSLLLIQSAVEVLEKGVITSNTASSLDPLTAVIVGVALTGLNPYFLIWWATVATPILEDVAAEGVQGFAVMYASHVWIDYAWLAVLAATGGAVSAINQLAYATLLAVLAAMLIVFAADMVLRTFFSRRILPF